MTQTISAPAKPNTSRQTAEEMLANVPFIVGSERSGTTLLRLMLDHHSTLAFGNEFEFAVDMIGADGAFPQLQDYYERLATHRIFLASGYTIDRALSYPQLVNSFLVQERDADGKPYVGATVHHHFDRILHVWPDARFVHLIRDGRDVARSCIDMGWCGNVFTGVQRWIDAEQIWERLSKKLPADRQITVTYETLVREPKATLTRLCEFMGIAFDPGMLDYSKKSTYEAPNPKFLEQWRRKLSEEEVRLVESRIGDMLVERGYALSGLPRLEVTPQMERKLLRQDRVGRAKFRVKRYGFSLFAADFVARRIGTVAWRKRVKMRINDEDTKHLK